MKKFNLRLVKQAVALAKPYWLSREGKKSYWMVGLLIVLLLADTQLNVWFNKQSGEFTSALAERDGARFWHSIRIFLLLLSIAVPEYSAYYYVRDRLGLNWRRSLTHRFVDRYFKNHAYYGLLHSERVIDNPDQRIADDIYSITAQCVNFLLIFTSAVFQLVAFGHVLWSISVYLILVLLAYATIATFLTFGVFGSKMISLHYNQRRKEADFRFGLVRVRENAESIALYRGEREEENRLRKLFHALYENYSRLIRWQFGLNFFQYTHTLLVMMLPSVIIAPRVLSGELEVGKIVMATGAFAAIMTSLTILVDNMEDLSRFAAGISRVRDLSISMQRLRLPLKEGREVIQTREGRHLTFENVTLQTPNYERILVKGLTASVPCGKNLMIVGGSGLGKSSLLRMIAGLWNSGAGIIERPAPEDVLFLPQHAYMIVGSLRDQLRYPNMDRDVTDVELRDILNRVNLSHMEERCGGLDVELDFEKLLSVGERQRLAVARVLLKQPRYVLLDEATSALDRENEAALYDQLAAMSATLISVSHHPALIRYHKQVLELLKNGEWRLVPAGEFKFTEEHL